MAPIQPRFGRSSASRPAAAVTTMANPTIIARRIVWSRPWLSSDERRGYQCYGSIRTTTAISGRIFRCDWRRLFGLPAAMLSIICCRISERTAIFLSTLPTLSEICAARQLPRRHIGCDAPHSCRRCPILIAARLEGVDDARRIVKDRRVDQVPARFISSNRSRQRGQQQARELTFSDWTKLCSGASDADTNGCRNPVRRRSGTPVRSLSRSI